MGKILKKFRLPWKLLVTLVRDRMYYKNRLLLDMSLIAGRCGVLLLLYWYVFKLRGGIVNGITFPFVAWSMFFYFSFALLNLRDVARLIMYDVQSGNVEVLFSKPVSYLSYRMWWQFGSGLYSFVFITVLATLALSLIIGFPPSMTAGIFIPTLILALVLGIMLTLLLYSSVGLLSFWIEDTRPAFWILDKMIMILGGSWLPVALFPDFMYKVAVWSPFGASQFVTHTVYESWQGSWPGFLGVQLFWILVLGLVVHFVFKKARQKVSVNGG